MTIKLLKLKIRKLFRQDLAFLVLSHLPWQFCDFGFSGRIIIEPTNSCNLRCPLCSTPTMKRGKGLLSLDNFKKIVDSTPKLKSIAMNFAGEPLLNKDIFKMVYYAEIHNIKVMISTNSVLLDRYIDEVLDSQLSSIIVCLDGSTKESHEKYRIGSDFDSVKKNIKMLCEEKKKRGLKFPKITLQCLITKYNEHEIPQIIKMSQGLGVDRLEFKTLSLGSVLDPIEKKVRMKNFLPSSKFSRYSLEDGNPIIKSNPRLCHWLRQSVILWNGDVVPCCYDFEGTFVIGNLSKEGGFMKVWKSDNYKLYRKKIIKRELSLCKRCNLTSEYSEGIDFN